MAFRHKTQSKKISNRLQYLLISELNSLPPWKIVHFFLLPADILQNQLFRKILSGIQSECQTDWIQTVCKSHQQTTLGGKELTFFVVVIRTRAISLIY